MLRQAAKESFILILVATIIALAVYWARPDRIETPSGAAKQTTGQSASERTGFSEIPIADAIQLYEANSALFADARHALDFAAGHIRGAVNLTVAEQDRWLSDFLAATDPATVIITYCDGDACHLATELAELFSLNGFERVYYLRNGWTRWRESGLPVD